MQTAAEIIASAEEFFDREALELQIDYCKTILRTAIHECRQEQSQGDPQSQADSEGSAKPATGDNAAQPAPKTKPARRARISLAQCNLCNQNLSLLTEALRLQKLLVRAAVNRALGEESPFADSPLPEHNGDLYADYCDRRLLLKPNTRTKPREGRGPETPNPFPPRPRSRVAEYFNALGGRNLNAQRLRSNEPEGRTAARQEQAPLPTTGTKAHTQAANAQPTDNQTPLTLLEDNAHPEAAHAQAVEQWDEQAKQWLRAADIRNPMPTLAPQAEEWLEQQAQQDPQAARWLLLLNEMKKIDHLMQFKAGLPAVLSDVAPAKSEASAKAGQGGARQTVKV